MANAEKRHVKCIQHHYREHLKRKSPGGAEKVQPPYAPPPPLTPNRTLTLCRAHAPHP